MSFSRLRLLNTFCLYVYIYNNVSKYYVHKSIRQYHDHITFFPTSFSSLPSHHMWRYLSSQVVAVLDVEDSSMEQGHIMMTERSVGAFHIWKDKGNVKKTRQMVRRARRRNPRKAREQASRRRIANYAALLWDLWKKHQNPGEASDLMETWWFANRDRCL